MCKYEDREYLLLNALEYSHVYFYQLQAAASPAVGGRLGRAIYILWLSLATTSGSKSVYV